MARFLMRIDLTYFMTLSQHKRVALRPPTVTMIRRILMWNVILEFDEIGPIYQFISISFSFSFYEKN